MPRHDTKRSDSRSGPRVEGQFAYEGLERIMHERARLSILTSLAAHAQGLVFNDLKRLCALTDGNLSRQLQILQEAGLVEIWKGTKGRRPQTLCRLTETGRARFVEYIAVLERVVVDAAAAKSHLETTSAAPPPRGIGLAGG